MQVFDQEKPRQAKGFMQGVSLVASVAVFCLSLAPLSEAVAAQKATRSNPVTAAPLLPSRVPGLPARHADDRYAETLTQLRELLRPEEGRVRGAAKSINVETNEQQRLELIRNQVKQLKSLDVAASASFDGVHQWLDNKKSSKEIRVRQRSIELVFKHKQEQLRSILEKFGDADASGDQLNRAKSLKELGIFLADNQPESSSTRLDLNKLPWRVQDGKVRQPSKSPKAFARLLARSSNMAIDTTEVSNTLPRAVAASASEDLSETDDVQITQAIRDLANSLGKNPVKMYNWVRNNIKYVPSFGSIQGSDATLSKRHGNSFDTASLLIALFRASDIPARYVYGTIQVPASTAMNWAGGVAKPEAAQQLWGQGGVPNAAVISDGHVSSIQLEHVWVEAMVDMAPSRGQKQRQGDTWVPLDASFKQSTEKPSLIAVANVPVDVDALKTAVLAGAAVNEVEGWSKNQNVMAAQSAAQQYKNHLKAFAASVNPNPTFEDVFGARPIIREEPSILAATLPYTTVAVGARYSDLPPSLTQQFRYKIYASELDRANENPMLSFTESLPKLAGRKVMVAYIPASQADADLIIDSLPKSSADGTPPSAEALRGVHFPAYLIQMKPQLRVDGVVVATGEPVTMGTVLPASGAFRTMDLSSGWDETSDVLMTGQVTAIGLDMQGIDILQANRLVQRLKSAQTMLTSGDTNSLLNMPITSDLLTLTLWRYFASVDPDASGTLAMSRMVDLPALSYGLVHVGLELTSVLGVNLTARTSVPTLDIGHLRAIRWSKDNDKTAWVDYNKLKGVHASQMEQAVLDSVFLGPSSDASVQAFSAVGLIAKAAATGQRIYKISQANAATAIPQLLLSARTIENIQLAIMSGKVVTVHEKPVELEGWTGTGYYIVDPETGSGAYLIEGGANGATLGGRIAFYALGLLYGGGVGLLMFYFVEAMLINFSSVGFFASIALAGPALLPFLLAISMVALLFWIAQDMHDKVGHDSSGNDYYQCFSGGFALGWSLMARFAFPQSSVLSEELLTILGGTGVAKSSLECLSGLDANTPIEI